MDDTTSFTPDSLNVSEIDWDASLNELVALAAKDFQSDMKSEPAVANVVELLLLMVLLLSDVRVVVTGIALPAAAAAAAVPAFVVGVDGVTTVFSSDINRTQKKTLFLCCLFLYSRRRAI